MPSSPPLTSPGVGPVNPWDHPLNKAKSLAASEQGSDPRSGVHADSIREHAKAICRTLLKAPAVIGGGVLRVANARTLIPWSPVICGQGMESLIQSCLQNVPGKIMEALSHQKRVTSLPVSPSVGLLVGTKEISSGEQVVLFLMVNASEARIPDLHRIMEVAVNGLDRPRASHDSLSRNHSRCGKAGPDATPSLPCPDESKRVREAWEPIIFLLSDETRLRHPWEELARWCREELQAAWVWVAAPGPLGRSQRLRGMAGPLPTKLGSPVALQAQELLAEVVIRGKQAWELATHDGATNATQSLLQITHCNSLWAFPMVDKNGLCIGSLAAAFTEQDPRSPATHRQAFPEQLARSVQLIRMLTFVSWKFSAQRYFFWKGYSRRCQAALLAGIILLFAVVPVPAPLKCSCQVEPVQLRYVPAPYDGLIREVLVQPGSVVSDGQVLARMDRRELDWQLAAKDAESKQASKDHDEGMATGDTSKAQVAHFEMERLQIERELLQNQVQDLEIRSPLSGVILTGDPRKLTGARVARGQVLFETGPLDRLHAEVEVRPEHLRRARAQQAVTVRLDALPFRTFRGTVLSIAPRAETREDRHVFVALVELENVEHAMRPGMRGTARIHSGWRPMMVSWFERLAISVYGFLSR
jgi:Barrel-sandwich domain of CusB or HlyD membrane-fusion